MGSGRTVRRIGAGALILALVTAPSGAGDAAGDPAATERRLARAGVAAALRLRIHEAVQRGAASLAGRQAPDGSFADPRDPSAISFGGPLATDALCALALAHAGTPAAAAAADRTLARLLPAGAPLRDEIRRHAVTAALAAMVARERGADPLLVAALGDAILAQQDRKPAFWGARASRPGGSVFGVALAPEGPDRFLSDLETTRYAAFGLAAAEEARWRAPADAWTRLADGLLDKQCADGGWAFGPPWIASDSAGTLHGSACLGLGVAILKRRGPLTEKLASAAAEGMGGARAALAEEAADILWVVGRSPGFGAGRSASLHDLSAALALAGLPAVDGDPWFPRLAGVVLAGQGAGGGWPGGSGIAADDAVATAFAILTLVRAPESLLSTPSAEPGPPPASPPPLWPDAGARPPTEPVPLVDAEDALAWLEEMLADPRSPLPSLEASLRFVGRAHGRIAAASGGTAPPEAEAWTLRAENAFLRALVLLRPDGEPPRNAALPVNLVASRLLAHASPRVASAMRRRLEESWFRPRTVPVEPAAWREAFAALARLGGADSFRWLAEDALTTDTSGPRRDRAREALRALVAFHRVPGRMRREAAERIVLAHEAAEDAASPDAAGGVNPAARLRWKAARRGVMDALHALCRDPATGKAASDAAGRALLTVRGFTEWLRERKDLTLPPWRDR